MLEKLLISTQSIAFLIPIVICTVSTLAVFLSYKLSKE